jgi:hypothetical protein
MDSIKGAIVLRERFGDPPAGPEAGRPAAVPADAPPIFHWVAAGAAPELGRLADEAPEA